MPLKQFCCSICGACAPRKYLKHNQFGGRMRWLWHHRKHKHPTAHKRSVRKSKEARRLL